ncbi:hypothetical protein [Candidatus Nanoperiomorbus periodonticus]|uniref:hypothetical protein n=1 Tax=Candidatus Nanoperiomorbus periodonticus TaxID=2171989 RepID=UPI00101CF1E3|nr:hypothetical protein [Candidatus Nanoperiomorbus periodonticus]RYC75364.1 hypothetical protein G52EAM_00551 [Candidatus Nanoperiomorbus periodonticus]
MKQEGGYTVLETGLAIAMSTTLVLLTFGLAAMVGRGRFRDSLVTTQSFIKQQYNEVRSGINSRLTEGDVSTNNMEPVLGCKNTAIPGNNNSCYIIGRLLTFDNEGEVGRVQSSYIIATVPKNSKTAWPDGTKTGLDNLKDSNVVTLYALTDTSGNDAGLNPTVKQIGSNKLEKVWLIGDTNMNLYDSNSNKQNPNQTNNIAIMRSPVDGSLVVVLAAVLDDVPNASVKGLKKINLDLTKTNMSQDDKVVLAVSNSGLGYPGGVICVPGGDSSTGISNNFNVTGSNWNWDGKLKNVGYGDMADACKNWEYK